MPLLIVAGVLLMAGNGVSFAAAAEMAGPRRVGTALGLQNTVLAVAVAIAPPAFGATVGLLSWPAAFALAAACTPGGLGGAAARWPARSAARPDGRSERVPRRWG